MSITEPADNAVNEAIEKLVELLERKTQFGKFGDDAAEIVSNIAKLRASMNPTIIHNNYGPQS